jgi:hypothetical protein
VSFPGAWKGEEQMAKSEREQAEEAQRVAATESADDPIGAAVTVPCADVRPRPDFLFGLTFTKRQEQKLRQIMRREGASREQVLERLWERVVTGLIAAEAEKVLDEMDPGNRRKSGSKGRH